MAAIDFPNSPTTDVTTFVAGDVTYIYRGSNKWEISTTATAGTIKTATASGTDTYTATISGVTAYTIHDVYEIIFTNANTGASTININGLGAKTLKKSVSTDLASGDILAGQSFIIVYDGTNFQMIGLGGSGGGGLSIQETAPGSPSTGDLWLDNSDDAWILYVYYDSHWIELVNSGGGTSLYWKTLPGTPTRSSNTVLTITDTGNANLYDLKFGRGTVLKWTDTTTHMAMVHSATYAANTVTITIIGDVLSGTATMSSFKYTNEKAKGIEFAIAGTLATGDDLSGIFEADKPYRVFGADAYVHTAGTTGDTDFEIRKNGSANSLFTTDIRIASTVLRGYGFTADDNSSLAYQDICSLSINAVSTTAPIDCYVTMWIFPSYNEYLT